MYIPSTTATTAPSFSLVFLYPLSCLVPPHPVVLSPPSARTRKRLLDTGCGCQLCRLSWSVLGLSQRPLGKRPAARLTFATCINAAGTVHGVIRQNRFSEAYVARCTDRRREFHLFLPDCLHGFFAFTVSSELFGFWFFPYLFRFFAVR